MVNRFIYLLFRNVLQFKQPLSSRVIFTAILKGAGSQTTVVFPYWRLENIDVITVTFNNDEYNFFSVWKMMNAIFRRRHFLSL